MTDYRDPMPELGYRLPPEILREVMQAPPLMSAKEASPFMNMSPSRIRTLIRERQLTGVSARVGSERIVIPRSAVLAYWERRYLADQQRRAARS